MRQKWFHLTVVLFILMLFSWLAMTYSGGSPRPYSGQNKYGFQTAIVWLELVQTPQEIFSVLGPIDSTQGNALRQSMDQINKYDFLFMFFYTLFFTALLIMLWSLVSDSSVLKQKNRSRWIQVIIIFLGCAMLLGDVQENRQLFVLTWAPSVEAFTADGILSSSLTKLILWTYVKWAALFTACAMGAYFLYIIQPESYKRLWSILPANVFAAAAFLGFLGLHVEIWKALVESAALLMFLGWFSSVVLLARISYGKKK